MASPHPPDYARILKEFTEADAGSSLEKTRVFLDNKLPDKVHRNGFHRWVENQRSLPPEIVKADAVIRAIKSTDFATKSNHLVSLLRSRSPYIPIGVIDGVSFRLAPDPFYLQSEFKNDNILRARTDDLDEFYGGEFRQSILSVSLPSSSISTGSSQSNKHKRNANTPSSDMSSKKLHAKSPEQGSTLTFFQLGMLEYYMGEGQAFEEKGHWNWSTTDFGVGVEITDKFEAGAIYLIYRFRQEHDDGYTFRVDKDDDSDWGYLTCDSEETFSCAKIAESVDRFGKDAHLKLDIKYRLPLYVTHIEWMSRMKAFASEDTKQSGLRKIAHANTNDNGSHL